MKQLLVLLILIFPYALFGQTEPITVELKNGRKVNTHKIRIVSSPGIFNESYVNVEDRKIKIREIDRIYGTDQNGEERYFENVLLGPSEVFAERMFKSDRISIYATRVNFGYGYGYTEIKKEHLQYKGLTNSFYYEKDQNVIHKMKSHNLMRDIADHEPSLKYIKKGKSIFFIQMGLYAIGSAMIVKGVADTFQDTSDDALPSPEETKFKISPFFFAGAATLYIPFFLNPVKNKKYGKALEVYE